MFSRDKAEQILIDAMRKSLSVGFVPIQLGNARLGINLNGKIVSAGLDRSHPLSVNMLNERALKTVQIEMLQQLFRRYGAEFSPAEANAMMTTLLGASVTRYAKSFIKAIPIISQLLSDETHSLPVLAAASTYALGQVAVLRLERDCPFFQLNEEAITRVYQQEVERGKSLAKTLESGHSNAAVALDFETPKQRYEQECRAPITPEDDPFAISIEDAEPHAGKADARRKSAKTPSNEPETLVAKFEQLAQLKASGLITEEEFQAQRRKLLAQM